MSWLWEPLLPAERCACGVVSRGLVTGERADCRARAVPAGGHPWRDRPIEGLTNEELVLATVSRTLRTVAFTGMNGGADLIELARDVERQTEMSLAMCCPVCQETTCDSCCPLAEVRTAQRFDDEDDGPTWLDDKSYRGGGVMGRQRPSPTPEPEEN